MVVGEILPNADITTQWFLLPADTNHWDYINENQGNLDTGNMIQCTNAFNNVIDQFHMTTRTGVIEVTQIKIWAYGAGTESGDYCNVRTSWDATWRRFYSFGDGVAWHSFTYAGISKNQAELDALQVGLYGHTNSPTEKEIHIVSCYAMYVEVTYTAPAGPSGIAKVYGIPSADIAKKYGVDWNSIKKIYGIE